MHFQQFPLDFGAKSTTTLNGSNSITSKFDIGLVRSTLLRTFCREDSVETANTATRWSSVKHRSTVKNGLRSNLKKKEVDVDSGSLLKWKEDGVERPGWSEISDESPSLKALWVHWDFLRVENGLLK